MTPDAFNALQRTDSHGRSSWVHLLDPVGTVEALYPDEVLPALQKIIHARDEGLHAVGWIGYEASSGFEPHLVTHPAPAREPLLHFTLFRTLKEGLPKLAEKPFRLEGLSPSWSEADFCERVERIRDAIALGETYQVNLTYPWSAQFSGCSRSLFRHIRLAQSARHQAYLEEEDRIIISASPERFFRLENGNILCRPMKGTAKPGEEGLLQGSRKDRAENVMIVDMIRNDLGQVATPGTVRTPGLFEIEPYPSLIQMTSTVSAEGPDDPLPWLKALFPCASITGAPKRRTMEWIRDLEPTPRGVYTGCIGGFYADGVTEFNVAIRTLQLDRRTGKALYSTGCGVVWDSDPVSEYAESHLKTGVLHHREPEYELFETMRFEPVNGILNVDRHLRRLTRSAAELGFEFDPEELITKLTETCSSLTSASRVRLVLSRTAVIRIEIGPVPDIQHPMTFKVDTEPTCSTHHELGHKTTRRSIYENARARCPEAQETLLINERGECMEFCIGSLLVEENGVLYTPPLKSGLLPGTARSRHLEEGTKEKILHPEDLENADAIFLINAVRGQVRMLQRF